MIHLDCINYDGDEDCHKCCRHGFIFGCDGCDDYMDFSPTIRRMIKAEEVGSSMKNYIDEKGNYINIENLSLKQIFDAGYADGYRDGTVDANQANARPKGKWVHSIAKGWECTNCNQTVKDMPITYNRKGAYKFCPNCGASMKGGAE